MDRSRSATFAAWAFALIAVMPLVGCAKKTAAVSDSAIDRPIAGTDPSATNASEDAPRPTAEAEDAQPADPHDIAEQLGKTVMPTDNAEFGFPNELSCSESGPVDPWSFRCGLKADDKSQHAPAILDIEIYDHDLVFAERVEMLKTMTLRLGTEGLVQSNGSLKFNRDGREIEIPWVCAQPRPTGPGFCIILPSPRILFVSIAARGDGELLSDDAMDRAINLSTIAMSQMPNWVRAP